MIHNSVRDDTTGDHWGVSQNDKVVLVQIQESGDQVRLGLTPEQAESMAGMLARSAQSVRNRRAEGNDTPGVIVLRNQHLDVITAGGGTTFPSDGKNRQQK